MAMSCSVLLADPYSLPALINEATQQFPHLAVETYQNFGFIASRLTRQVGRGIDLTSKISLAASKPGGEGESERKSLAETLR